MPDAYSVPDYGRMIADRARTEAYARALEAAVRPGAVVLDIGTGTGIFALLACRFGARRVYAVEPGDVIQTARELARANGVEDRVTFLQELSTRVDLPERADVVVSDVRGSLPLFGRIVPTLVDTRARLLAPGGVMIPRADVIRAAPASAPRAHAELVEPWDEGSFGFDASAARRIAVNSRARARVSADDLLAPAREWARLDYASIESADARGTLEWSVERAGTAHGISAWFDAELGDGIGFTTGPGTETIYGTAFFPWPKPVPLAPGDRVTVDLEARLVGDDYVWSWATRIAGSASEEFRQSTFLSEPLSPARLRRRAHDFRPRLDEEGRIEAAILARMDGSASLGEIARELRERFPARFATWEEALTRVGRISERHAEP